MAPGVNPSIVTNLDAPLSRELQLVDPPFEPNNDNRNLNSNTTLPPGPYGDVSLRGQAAVTFSPGTYVFRTLDVSGGASIRVNEGVVQIYVVGDGGNKTDLSLGGNSLVNSSMIPGNVLIFVGVDAREVTINGGPQVAAAIRAPLCDVTFNGTAGGFYGAIVGHTIHCNGQPGIHYDEALGAGDGGGELGGLEILSWQRF